MEADEALRMEARWIANSLRNLKPDGDHDQLLYRLRAYRPRDMRLAILRWVCPRCWLTTSDMAQNELRCVPGTDDMDVMRCEACQTDFAIPLN